MTLPEKISQMVYDAPAIERLGIPAYNWWNEALHGHARAGGATVFPQAIGLAATWDPDLLHTIATVISDEVRAKHHLALERDLHGIYAGLTIWSPNVNIFRDPRWGRGQETYGEDPYLTARMAVAFVNGLQGDDPNYLKLVTTAKHYAVHSGPESSRHHFDAHVSEQDLYETYLPAFEACVREAGVASVMGAYNRLYGAPCCASELLLQEILRQRWGFDGYVVSDCGAILDIYAHHNVVDTAAEAAALAVTNGCELNCGATYPALLDAVEQGLIAEETIDKALDRLFSARFRLGMFDPPEQVPYAQIPYEVVDSPAHRALALQAAQKSIVLLKNEAQTLPLSKDISSVAVIGPVADDRLVLLGNYCGTPFRATTLLDGIRSKVSSKTRIYYAPGSPLADGIPMLEPVPPTCLRPSGAHAGQMGLTGTYYGNAQFKGDPALCRLDAAVDFVWVDDNPLTGQWGDSFSVRWTGYLVPPHSGTYTLGVTGLNQYKLWLEGESLLQYNDTHHSILKTCHVDLQAGRLYPIRLDYTNRGLDPQVHLLWERPDSDLLPAALEAARQADVIVLALGLSPAVEGEEMPVHVKGFAGGDRTDIVLPAAQVRLMQAVHALGKPTVLALTGGSAIAIPWAAEHLPAILQVWYPGQAGGQALADILFGDVNPSGKLPVTVYRSIEDLPDFEDYAMAGRTYRYFQGEPLYSFGHGLSYTTFRYGDLRITPDEIHAGESVTVTIEVTNAGDRAGEEVVQLYLHQDGGTSQVPVTELKGFQRITLQVGQSETISFVLNDKHLARYDGSPELAVCPGTVQVMCGGSSKHLPPMGSFRILD